MAGASQTCVPDDLECVPLPGLVDDVGGSNLGGAGAAGEWSRIGTIEFDVDAVPDSCTFLEGLISVGQGGPEGGAVELNLLPGFPDCVDSERTFSERVGAGTLASARPALQVRFLPRVGRTG